MDDAVGSASKLQTERMMNRVSLTIDPRHSTTFMSPPKPSDRPWGPPSFQFCSYRGNLSTGTKKTGLEANDPYPSRAVVKNM